MKGRVTPIGWHPLLISTPLIAPILSGVKTQTRRLIVPQPVLHNDAVKMPIPLEKYIKQLEELQKKGFERIITDGPAAGYMVPKCPFRRAGDIIWVKERWAYGSDSLPYIFFAGYPDNIPAGIENIADIKELKWKSSRFMPFAAHRIELHLLSISVERLHDISEEDAIQEGVGHGFQMNAGWPDYLHIKDGICTLTQDTAEMSYATLWDSIHGEGAWHLNPWVWVLKFIRTKP